MTRLTWLVLGAAVALAACDKKEDASPSKSDMSGATTTAPTTSAAATETTAAAEDGEGLPTEADFENEAEQKITAANMEDELDKLEKEIEN